MIGPTNGKQDVGHLAKWNQILLIEDNVNQVDSPTTKPHSKAARSMAPFDRMHSQVQKSRPPSLASSKGAYGGFHCHMVWKQCKDPGKTCQFHMYIYICIYIYIYICIYIYIILAIKDANSLGNRLFPSHFWSQISGTARRFRSGKHVGHRPCHCTAPWMRPLGRLTLVKGWLWESLWA